MRPGLYTFGRQMTKSFPLPCIKESRCGRANLESRLLSAEFCSVYLRKRGSHRTATAKSQCKEQAQLQLAVFEKNVARKLGFHRFNLHFLTEVPYQSFFWIRGHSTFVS